MTNRLPPCLRCECRNKCPYSNSVTNKYFPNCIYLADYCNSSERKDRVANAIINHELIGEKNMTEKTLKIMIKETTRERKKVSREFELIHIAYLNIDYDANPEYRDYLKDIGYCFGTYNEGDNTAIFKTTTGREATWFESEIWWRMRQKNKYKGLVECWDTNCNVCMYDREDMCSIDIDLEEYEYVLEGKEVVIKYE